ncbi:MAG: aspartate aminotransferase family protein [Woeseiaceae bacterium]
MNIAAIEAEHTLPVYAQLDFVPVRGEGAWLVDASGRRVLDLYGGHAVAALGYNHPTLLSAVTNQLQTLLFQSNAVANPARAEAAAKLTAFAGDHLTRAFFVNSGAEANENALRLAFMNTGRKHVVAVEHGFHGRTSAAAAATWGASQKWYAFPSLPFDVTFVPRNDIDAALNACNEHTAAVIVEPIQGVAGAFDLDLKYLQALAASASRSGALFIADEVQCGMGRSGQPFAIDHAGVRADIVTSAKSLGGGIACGAVLTTETIAQGCKPGDLGTTFGGGPLAAAAINAVVDTIITDDLMTTAQEREQQVRDTCIKGPVIAIQGKGLLLGLRCKVPAKDVRNQLLAKGILTGTSGDPDVLRLLPPLNIQASEIDLLANALNDL